MFMDDLANALLDDRIELYGIDPTIKWLLDMGYSKFEIINSLRFEAEDVERVASKYAE